jgi:hypothetical protein
MQAKRIEDFKQIWIRIIYKTENKMHWRAICACAVMILQHFVLAGNLLAASTAVNFTNRLSAKKLRNCLCSEMKKKENKEI